MKAVRGYLCGRQGPLDHGAALNLRPSRRDEMGEAKLRGNTTCAQNWHHNSTVLDFTVKDHSDPS